MSYVIKAANIDFALLKPYKKAICFVLIVPVAFLVMSRSLISGISFSVCVMSMSSSYTFAVSEKNGMDRLYGILPVSKKQLVYGKYICVFSMGLLALLVSLIFQPLVLLALSVTVSIEEVVTAGLVGIMMFTFYIVFQIPGYYKYGSIKGRMFMYVPIAGFLLIWTLFTNTNIALMPVLGHVFDNPVKTACIGFLLIIFMLIISITVSIKILQWKEY